MRDPRWCDLIEVVVYVIVACVMALLVTSCAPRTIYVPRGEPVRLREDVPGAKVWIKDAAGKPVAGTVTLKEGWWCLEDAE